MNQRVIKDILEVLKKGQTFFITSHRNPDGDSLACETAMALFLERLGKKKYKIINRDVTPEIYEFLPRSHKILNLAKVKEQFDVALILDASDPTRTGEIIDLKKQACQVIVIDHHLNGKAFGDYHYFDEQSASCAQQVLRLIKTQFPTLTEAEATCIYVGILTETNRFQEANTNPQALRDAADLIEAGVDPNMLNRKIYDENSFAGLKILGRALAMMKVWHKDKVASILITKKMLKETRATVESTEGLINFPRSLKGVKVAILFREENGGFKVSLRSKDGVDVNKIARHFGGGGHRRAAGFFINGSGKDIQQVVLDYIGLQLGK